MGQTKTRQDTDWTQLQDLDHSLSWRRCRSVELSCFRVSLMDMETQVNIGKRGGDICNYFEPSDDPDESHSPIASSAHRKVPPETNEVNRSSKETSLVEENELVTEDQVCIGSSNSYEHRNQDLNEKVSVKKIDAKINEENIDKDPKVYLCQG